MTNRELTHRMQIRVVDKDGRVECERGGECLQGALATNVLVPGGTVRLVVGATVAETTLEVVGRALVDRKCVVEVGLKFDLDIKKISRAVTTVVDPFAPAVTQVAMSRDGFEGPSLSNRSAADVSGEAAPPRAAASPMKPPSAMTAFPAFSSLESPHQFAQAFGEMESEPSGVYGSLKGMSLPEVLQSLEHGRRDATVLIRPKGQPPGVLRVEGGQVIYAAHGRALGEVAFFALAPLTRGSFLIRFDAERPAGLTQNIDKHLHWLLLEAARRSDEESAPQSAPGDLHSALESAIVAQGLGPELDADPSNDHAAAFEHGETRPALFSQFFTEAEPAGGSHSGPPSVASPISALELDDELERKRAADEHSRNPSGWTGSFSNPSIS